MPLSEIIIGQAWERSGAHCECERTTHGHVGRCNKFLLRSRQGKIDTIYGWEAYNINGRNPATASDCEIICWEPCHNSMYRPERG